MFSSRKAIVGTAPRTERQGFARKVRSFQCVLFTCILLLSCYAISHTLLRHSGEALPRNPNLHSLSVRVAGGTGDVVFPGEIVPGMGVSGATSARRGGGELATAKMKGGLQDASTGPLLITSDVVAQGESFTGVIVTQTDKGTVPLDAGEKVVISGAVVDVKPGGEVDIPAIHQLGNIFVTPQIKRMNGAPLALSQTRGLRTASLVRRGQEVLVPVAPHHVEVMQVAKNVPIRIAHAPDVLGSSTPIRVQGQGLNLLQKVAMVSADGNRAELGQSVGSSLERIYLPRPGAKLPPGNLQFVAEDANGNTYKSSNPSYKVTLAVSGEPIKQKGQTGNLTIGSDKDVIVKLSGGAPQINIAQPVVSVKANAPQKVPFTALVVGTYSVRVDVPGQQEIPPTAKTPTVDIKPEPVKTMFDPVKNETSVTAPIHVVDKLGKPVPNTDVSVAITHPQGVEYGHVTTDGGGHANFIVPLVGAVAVTALAVHAYHVSGHKWTKEPPPGQQQPGPVAPEPPAQNPDFNGILALNPEHGVDPACENGMNLATESCPCPCSDTFVGIMQDAGGGSVDLYDGGFSLDITDLQIPGRGFDWKFERKYRSAVLFDGPLGHNWEFNYNRRLAVGAGGSVTRMDGRGRSDKYEMVNGQYTAPWDSSPAW